MEEFPAHENLSHKSAQPIAIVSQLLQNIANMHHIDELLAWLAAIMVERFNMLSVQVWAVQAHQSGTIQRKLRASSSLSPSQAARVLESAEVRVFVERLLRERRGILSLPVNGTFSRYQAALFAQEDCLYWTAYFLSKDVFLPLVQTQPEREEVPTHLQMLFSFFTQDPLQPSQARALSFLIEQSLRLAIGHGLLSHMSEKQEVASKADFGHFIPEHIQVTKMEQGDNPFTHAVVIPEKRSRQMYNFIDGKKNIQELTLLMQIGQKDCLEMLQMLLLNGYINIREMNGNLVEISTFSQKVEAEFK